MAYNNPKTVTYSRVIGTTTTTWAVQPPAGMTQCRVKDINVSATTLFTTGATIGVGVTGSTSALGQVALGALAAGSAVGFGSQYNKGVNPVYGSLDLTGTSNTLTGAVPEVVGPILITFTATAAGAGVADITLDWF